MISIALAAIACTVIGVGVVLPAVARANSGLPIHLSESRMFDILGTVALVHLVLTMLRPAATPRWLGTGTMIAQAGLIAFLIHARTSVSWLFVAILLIVIVLAVFRPKRHVKLPQSGAVLAVVCTVLLAWAGVHLYQRAAFNAAYFGEIGPRTFWHNVLMGLATNSVLAHKLDLVGEDRSTIETVLRDMKTRSDPRLTEQWETQNILNSLGSFSTFDWRTYEDITRDLIFRTLRSEPRQAAKLFLWDKPGRVLGTISCEFLLLRCDPLRSNSGRFPERPATRFLPLLSIGFLVLVAASLCASSREYKELRTAKESNGTIVLLLLLAALIGLAPSILVYPAVSQLGGTVVLLLTAIGLALVLTARGLRLKSYSGVEQSPAAPL